MKTTRTLLTIFVLGLPFLGFHSVRAQSEPIEIAIQPLEMLPQQTRNLVINLSNPAAHSIFSYQFSLSFDTTYVTIDSIETHNSLSEDGFFYHHIEEGLIHVAYASATALGVQGTLLQLVVRSKAVTGTVPVRFDSFSIDEGSYLAVLTPGEIHIEDAPSGVESDSVLVMLQLSEVHTNTSFEATAKVSDLFSGFRALDFILEYDPLLLTVQEVTFEETLIGSTDPSQVFIRTRLSDPGKIYGVIAGTQPITGEGDLFRIQFTSHDQAGESPLFFSRFNLDEGKLNPILIPETVRINWRIRAGDASLDSLITLEDALLVIDHVTASNFLEGAALQAAEVSGNGLVSSYDASLIMQYAAGLIPCFPVETGCQVSKHRQVSGYLAWGNPGKTDSDLNTLSLEVHSASTEITSIDLQIPLGHQPVHSVSIHPDLPADWHWQSSKEDGVLLLSMAGASTITTGKILDLVFREDGPHAEIGAGVFQLNDEAPENLPPPASLSRDIETTLHSNFPNPFEKKTTLSFSLSRSTSVKLEIVDVLGRHIETLVEGNVPAGQHLALFDGSDLGPGIYFFRLSTGTETLARQMIKK